MGRRVRLLSALLAGTLAFVVGASTANAGATNSFQYKCQTAIAKEGGKFAGTVIKLHSKCISANLKVAGSCTGIDAGALSSAENKLAAGIDKVCNVMLPSDFADMGFPGASCTDANPNDGFTLADLQSCIRTTHEGLIGGRCEGGSNAGQACSVVADCPDSGLGTSCHGLVQLLWDQTVAYPLTGNPLTCQKTIASAGAKVATTTIKAVQKCRNDLLNCKTDTNTLITTCKKSGILPENCATSDPKTATAIQKAKDKAAASIQKKCQDPDIVAVKACEPDQTTAGAGASCVADNSKLLMDDPFVGNFDLLDYEYSKAKACGDNLKNLNNEECDGSASPACPGDCGPSDGFFACLCTNTPRERVVEHGNADLDNGWSGTSHDSGIVEGGGYVSDLWDCDGPGGPDTLCNVGPTCNLAPHQSCSPAPSPGGVNADTLCPGVGNFCRMTLGGVQGKHCAIDFKRRCKVQADCPGAGDSCVTTLHGAPLPLSAGGVAVCVLNEFTEDVVGTTDLATGASAVRLRQDSRTFQGGSQSQPCPVCGGFCSGTASSESPNQRTLCSSNADCTAPSTCITENICSYGSDMDKRCNPNPPEGGPTEFFGNPSKDCRIDTGELGNIDILFNPATTNTVTLTANQLCQRTGFNNKRCAGGTNEFAQCTTASECPGGTCNDQCFCALQPAESSAPNGCQSACRGGPDDAQPCTTDGDCGLPGFCHPADCRLNPLDSDSSQEGQCTVGPTDGTCSVHPFVTCTQNSSCSNVQQCVGGMNDDAPCTTGSQCPGGVCALPVCPGCDDNETCSFNTRQCFVSPTIQRDGIVGTPNKTTAAVFCIAKTISSAVNNAAGLPGPGAITTPTTTIDVGF